MPSVTCPTLGDAPCMHSCCSDMCTASFFPAPVPVSALSGAAAQNDSVIGCFREIRCHGRSMVHRGVLAFWDIVGHTCA